MLKLTDLELQQLQQVMRISLSPLSYPSTESWLLDIMRTMRELLGADRSVSTCLADGKLTPVAEADEAQALAEYTTYYQFLPHGWQGSRRERRLQVCSVNQLYDDHRQYKQSEFYNDFSRQHGLTNGMSLAVDFDDSAIGTLWYHEHDIPEEETKRRLDILRLAWPAFHAGVTALTSAGKYRKGLLDLLDHLTVGVIVHEPSNGQVLHQNTRIRAMEAEDPEFSQCYLAAAELARRGAANHGGYPHGGAGPDSVVGTGQCLEIADFGTSIGSTIHVETRAMAYVLSLCLVPDPHRDTALQAIFVTRDRTLTDHALASRFNLTRRECGVARLLLHGKSNKEIAAELSISVHTACHHVEHVFRKLGAQSRSEASAILRGMTWVPEP